MLSDDKMRDLVKVLATAGSRAADFLPEIDKVVRETLKGTSLEPLPVPRITAMALMVNAMFIEMDFEKDPMDFARISLEIAKFMKEKHDEQAKDEEPFDFFND